MPPSPAISLHMAVWNREDYLGPAIESVLGQTRGDFELIVADDGSTDGSLAVAQGYARRDPRVRVITCEHGGANRALRRATELSTGAYLGMVDSDDLLEPTALAEAAAVLDADAAAGVVYTDYLDIGPGVPRARVGRAWRR